MIKLEYGKQLIKKSHKKIAVQICVYIIIAVVFLALERATITTHNLSPFALPFLFALYWCGAQPFVLSLVFMISSILIDYSQKNITIAIIAGVLLIISALIHKKVKKEPNLITCYLLLFITLIPFVLFNATTTKTGVSVMVAVIAAFSFMFVAVAFFSATIKRGFNIKLNLDEKLCGGILLVVISLGLGNLNIYNFEIIKLVAAVVILTSTYLFSSSVTIVLGSLMGLGLAISLSSPIYIAAFVCYALLSVAFKIHYRVLSCVSIILAEVLFGLYFTGYVFFGWQSVASVAVGGVIFILIPKSINNYIKDVLGSLHNKVLARNIVNRSKESVCKRMLEIADVFKEMDSVFRSMIKGSLSDNDAKVILANELIQSVCVNCTQKNKCLRINGEYTTEVLSELVEAGYQKGKVTLIDVSQYLSSRCIKLNYLISTFNSLIDSYKTHSSIMSSLDASRLLIADQLGGVHHIMKQFVNEINKNITFDTIFEKKIIEELAYKNIACIEVLVYEQDIQEKNVTLLIKDKSLKENIIEKTVSKVCNSSMEVVSITPSELPNVSVVNLKTKLNFDIVFGSATIAKNHEANGDAHSIIRLSNGKYLLAVCDGMGNGIGAKETSSLAISLIENFYKAGFENEMILNSVNKLLALANDEKFSALDLCVLDMRKNLCDFIKLGSPNSYIKHKNSTDEVVGSGLPIGIVEEMQPKSIKIFLQSFDTIVLVSDGVSDAFSKTSLKTIINNLTSINPQTLADEIMLAAKRSLGGVINDDMTVLVARVFPTTYKS